MNKNQQKMAQYGYTIDAVMTRTDELQDALNPMFLELRAAIDDDKVAAIDAAHYADIREQFATGTAEYKQLLTKFEAVQVPARFIGNHKMLTKAFAEFVAGCQQMTDSLKEDQTIDAAAFKASEQVQDDESEKISKYLNKIQVLA